jgi:hypothetical protein
MRCAFAILLSLLTFAPLAAQAPTVTISIPTAIPSEDLQITYHMTGKFGGYAGSVEPRPGLSAYRINASSGNQPATEMKIIAYAPGCDFQTLTLSLLDNPNRFEPFVCKTVPKVSLSGVFPASLIKGHNAELLVTYQAYWAHTFFGILDGFVTTFNLAKITPQQDGTFRVELPDFSSRMDGARDSLGADLQMMLRDAKTWNHLATDLSPEDATLKGTLGGLKIQSSYPANLRFASGF